MNTYGEDRKFEGWPYVNSTVYALLLLVLALGEVPMNMVVFRLFGEIELFNLLLALVLALILPGAAHLTGVKLKLHERTVMDVLMIAVCIAIVAVGLPVIGLIREQYLERYGMPNDRLLTTAFVVIQYLVFWGALVLSYAHSYPWLDRTMQAKRDRWISSAIVLDKNKASRLWEIDYWRNGIDRVKDAYVAANLLNRKQKTPAPLVFYLEDYDESIRNPMKQAVPEET